MFFHYLQPPLEFRDKMLDSIKFRATELQNSVETVMDGLQSIANTLATKKVST